MSHYSLHSALKSVKNFIGKPTKTILDNFSRRNDSLEVCIISSSISKSTRDLYLEIKPRTVLKSYHRLVPGRRITVATGIDTQLWSPTPDTAFCLSDCYHCYLWEPNASASTHSILTRTEPMIFMLLHKIKL